MMRKSTVILIIVAICLVIVGSIIFGGVMVLNKWDFSKLSTVKYETNTYDLTGEFNDISIITDTASIEFLLSDDEKCKVICYEESNAKHYVSVENNALSVKVVNTKKWYDHIGIFNGIPKISVYLPKTAYKTLSVQDDTGAVEIPSNISFNSIDILTSTGYVENKASASDLVKIKTATGSILVENITANSLDLSVSTGKITVVSVVCENEVSVKVSTGKTELTDVKCKNLTSKGSTGKVTLDNVIATEMISIERSTGDVIFTECDASELFVETDTGDIHGSFLSNKIFITKTDTGRINIPHATEGGKCEMITDTGDIIITIIE